MRTLLFAEGSATIGAGHCCRTAAIARALAAAGDTAVLAGRAHPGSPHPWAWTGLDARMLDPGSDLAMAVDRAIRDARPDVVVIDHYGVGGEALARLAARHPAVVVDDIPDRDLGAAALVVAPAATASPADHPDAPVVAGPAWAPVRPEFRDQGRPRDALALVMLGSGVPGVPLAATVRAIRARTGLDVDVVAAGAAPAAEAGIRWHRGLDATAVAALMGRARVGALSASQVVLEAAACGLPFVAVATVANQARFAESLARVGATVLDPARLADLPDALAAAASAPPALRVDGQGAARVAARVRELAVRTDPRLHPARWRDADLLLAWANDADTRRASFREAAIGRDEHLRWLARQLSDPDARLFIARDGDAALGTVRLNRQGPAATVSIAVAPEQRGRGVGRRLLAALAAWSAAARFADALDAWVRDDNPASLKLFAGAGYALAEAAPVDGRPARRFRLRVR